MLTFGSLCDGIGCFSLALKRSGMEPRWLVEIDAYCRRVTARNFPGVVQFDDIRDIGRSNLEPVDVLVGGTPCQDISVAGRRAGLAGERSGLFFEFARIADEITPVWVLWENVFGALSSCSGRDFASVLGALTGYTPQVPKGGWRNAGICVGPKRGAAWRVLDAQFVGGCPLHVDERGIGPVPQSRRRVFVVASLGDGSGPVQVLFEPESSERHLAAGRKKGKRTSSTTGSRTAKSGVERHRDNQDHDTLIAFDKYNQIATGELACTIGAGSKEHNNASLPLVFQANGAGSFRSGAVSLASGDDNNSNQIVVHCLRSGGCDASEDGTGRGTPLVVVESRMVAGKGPQQTGDDNTAAPRGEVGPTAIPSDESRPGTPGQQSAKAPADVVAYQCHGGNVGPMGVLRSGNGGLTGGVPFIVNAAESCAKESHARQADVARSLDTTGGFAANQGGTVVVYDVVSMAQQGCNHAYATDVAGCLQHKGLCPTGNEAGTVVVVNDPGVVAFQGRGRDGERSLEYQENLAYSLNAPAGGGCRHENNISSGMVVRRLLPVECLRLMGLPDDWLDVSPPLSDSRKYHMIGNGGVVQVVEWIGRRIVVAHKS